MIRRKTAPLGTHWKINDLYRVAFVNRSPPAPAYFRGTSGRLAVVGGEPIVQIVVSLIGVVLLIVFLVTALGQYDRRRRFTLSAKRPLLTQIGHADQQKHRAADKQEGAEERPGGDLVFQKWRKIDFNPTLVEYNPGIGVRRGLSAPGRRRPSPTQSFHRERRANQPHNRRHDDNNVTDDDRAAGGADLVDSRLAGRIFDLDRTAFLQLIPRIGIDRIVTLDGAAVGGGEAVIDLVRSI